MNYHKLGCEANVKTTEYSFVLSFVQGHWQVKAWVSYVISMEHCCVITSIKKCKITAHTPYPNLQQSLHRLLTKPTLN